jgi:hypothetical protein
MKKVCFLNLTLGAIAFILAGCASDKPSTSAKMPPPTPIPTYVEPEVAPTGETSTTTSTTTTVTEQTTAPVVAPTDTGSVIPLKDLPTKKGNGQSFPYAIKTKWPGLVKSPYAQEKTLVDVSTLSSGSFARCPHTGKIFVVP